jgi:hypothetical protein
MRAPGMARLSLLISWPGLRTGIRESGLVLDVASRGHVWCYAVLLAGYAPGRHDRGTGLSWVKGQLQAYYRIVDD